ncbi:MAG: phytoene desaturase family protein, partial [Akkermansiaceae bacterium]|nr:phytoene desaturase family protein [Akkermansiaceae bacterium]
MAAADKKHILIVGAGPGGLSAAMTLANRGFRVTVVEKSDRVGGRNAELKLGDYSFDVGPTFLHQKFCLDEVFAEADRKPEDYLDLVDLNPMTRLTWGDTSLHTYSDQKQMVEELEKVFPGSSAGFKRYMKEQAVKFRKIYPCLQRPYQTLGSFFSPNLLKALPYVLTNKSVHDALGNYFDDERLKLAFTFQAKYLGMSPWHCPALFSILSFTEYRFGVYHVQGGLNRISHAMAEVVGELGGEIRLNAGVRELTMQGRTLTGAILENGETITADAVVLNADYGHAATQFFGKRSIPVETLKKKQFSCSTFMIYVGLDTIYPNEPHHHILFADDYAANVHDIQSQKRISEDMSIYIRNSSVTDPHVAPAGKSG